MIFKSRWAKQKMDKNKCPFLQKSKGFGKMHRCDHKFF